MKHAFLVAMALLLSACSVLPEGGTGQVLTIGDSVLAWNRGAGAAIPDVVEKRSGQSVINGAVPGAGMLTRGARGAVGFSIPGQYRAGDWRAVILNGGANDLRGLCGCRRCDAVLDRLITQDGTTGAYPALLSRIDAPVIIVGYYGPVQGGGGSFDGCDDELQEMGRRLARLAARDDTVTFVQTRTVVRGNPAYYDTDLVHPNRAGSAVIGGVVARALVAIDGPSR